MKKRALILAMIAFIAATTSEPSINMVRAEETQVEETQVEETQTEENAGQTSERSRQRWRLFFCRNMLHFFIDVVIIKHNVNLFVFKSSLCRV